MAFFIFIVFYFIFCLTDSVIRNYGIVANSLNFLSKFSLNGMTLSNITKTQAVVVSLCLALLLVASIGLARQFTVKAVSDCQRKNQPFDYSICELDAKIKS
jgi:hypothetical protein